MIFDDNVHESKARPIFRILAFIIGVLGILLGVLSGLLFSLGEMKLFNNEFNVFVTSLLWGTFFLKVAIRGQAKKSEEKNTLLTGQKPKRVALLFELAGYVFFLGIVFIILSHNHWTTTWWWVGFLFLGGILTRFFTVSYVMLTSLGYNPWLSATIVFPIYLMYKLTIKPEQNNLQQGQYTRSLRSG